VPPQKTHESPELFVTAAHSAERHQPTVQLPRSAVQIVKKKSIGGFFSDVVANFGMPI